LDDSSIEHTFNVDCAGVSGGGGGEGAKLVYEQGSEDENELTAFFSAGLKKKLSGRESGSVG